MRESEANSSSRTGETPSRHLIEALPTFRRVIRAAPGLCRTCVLVGEVKGDVFHLELLGSPQVLLFLDMGGRG